MVLVLSFSSGFGAETPALSTGISKSMKVGYVDVRKVFDSCTATQLATLSLKGEMETRQGSLAREEEEIISL